MSAAVVGLAGIAAGAWMAANGGGGSSTLPAVAVAQQAATPAEDARNLTLVNIAADGTPEPAPTPSPTSTPPPAPQAPPIEGLRIWSDGDSTSFFMTVSLFQLAAGYGAVPVRAADYKISSGLVRNEFFDWPAYVPGEMATYDPDVVVFMVGANDANQVGTWESYGAKVGAMMDMMHREGRRVFWVGQPNHGRAELAASVPTVNAIFQEQASIRSWVTYVDTWTATSDADGNYSAYAVDDYGVTQLIRASDGVHFTSAGGDYLARIVLRAVLGR
ncbi:MAG: DUF459 domain-containing protein [Dehalococcoidia bacterium]|nr:DUF459 domain-containing protein [Dehalococcoidia bacterium]